MEKFKAVEKAMKTKAYSKEGLSAAAKLDPKEQAKVECSDFLSGTVDELEQQIETLEAESESLSATMKRGKSQTAKAERIATIERIIERHKWHQGKLEMIRRALENGGVDVDQVMELEEGIKYYVSDGMNDDYVDDDELYDELDLDENEATFAVGHDEKNSSQDAQSTQDEPPPESEPPKSRKGQKEPEPVAALRKPSSQPKSPLAGLATLNTPLSNLGSGASGAGSGPAMKPAQVPTRPAGEGLKYASAAAAAAASDKAGMGISPLPPPPGASPIVPMQSAQARAASATNSPATTSAQPAAAQPGAPDAETPALRSRKSKAAGKQTAAQETEAAKRKL